MTREVLPPRPAFSLRPFLLAALLSACAAHYAASTYEPTPNIRPLARVPVSVWRLSVGHEDMACDHQAVRPALLCRVGFSPSFDGCRWGCLSGLEPQQ